MTPIKWALVAVLAIGFLGTLTLRAFIRSTVEDCHVSGEATIYGGEEEGEIDGYIRC